MLTRRLSFGACVLTATRPRLSLNRRPCGAWRPGGSDARRNRPVLFSTSCLRPRNRGGDCCCRRRTRVAATAGIRLIVSADLEQSEDAEYSDENLRRQVWIRPDPWTVPTVNPRQRRNGRHRWERNRGSKHRSGHGLHGEWYRSRREFISGRHRADRSHTDHGQRGSETSSQGQFQHGLSVAVRPIGCPDSPPEKR